MGLLLGPPSLSGFSQLLGLRQLFPQLCYLFILRQLLWNPNRLPYFENLIEHFDRHFASDIGAGKVCPGLDGSEGWTCDAELQSEVDIAEVALQVLDVFAEVFRFEKITRFVGMRHFGLFDHELGYITVPFQP